MDALRQSLYRLDLAPYLFGTVIFLAFFALLITRRTRILHPRRLWILPSFAWIIAAATMANALPQTGMQVVGFVVLAATGLGIGVLLCLSDSLKRGPTADTFRHTNSILSVTIASTIIAVMVGYHPSNLWPGIIFLAGLVSGRSICLWRWAEYLRHAPEISTHTGM